MFAVAAPAHQPFFSNGLGFSAAEEACSRNVRASGTLKFGMKVFLRLKLCTVTGIMRSRWEFPVAIWTDETQ